jgi:hypothetical protein
VILAAGALALGLVTGCGNGGDERAVEQAPPANEAAPHGDAQVAVHDCAGPCGMKAVPETQLTQVDGKWYCAGCVAKATADAGKTDHPR